MARKCEDIDLAIEHFGEQTKMITEYMNELRPGSGDEMAADHCQIHGWLVELKELRKAIFDIGREANNYIYFDDSSDYKKGLYEILKIAMPDLLDKDLKYMPHPDDLDEEEE